MPVSERSQAIFDAHALAIRSSIISPCVQPIWRSSGPNLRASGLGILGGCSNGTLILPR